MGNKQKSLREGMSCGHQEPEITCVRCHMLRIPLYLEDQCLTKGQRKAKRRRKANQVMWHQGTKGPHGARRTKSKRFFCLVLKANRLLPLSDVHMTLFFFSRTNSPLRVKTIFSIAPQFSPRRDLEQREIYIYILANSCGTNRKQVHYTY
jgi:hypothetical protein